MQHFTDWNHKQFDGPTSLANEAARSRRGQNENREFFGDTVAGIQDKARRGDISALAEARALAGKLRPRVFAPSIQMVADVCGGVPIVAEYLSGEPEHMRTLVQAPDASAPLTIGVDITTSGGFSPDDCRKRGVTILALVEYMSAIRPVDLIAYVVMNGDRVPAFPGALACAVSCKLDYSSASQAQIVNALTNVGFARSLCYGIGESMGFNGYWPSFPGVGLGRTTHPDYLASCRRMLGIDGDCFMVPAFSMYDDTTQNPERWINDALDKLGHGGDV